jgi:hypothetical protein
MISKEQRGIVIEEEPGYRRRTDKGYIRTDRSRVDRRKQS